MAPGASRLPAAKYKKSVEAIPRSITDTPTALAPSAKAAVRVSPEGRMSRAIRIVSTPAKVATAEPIARHMASSIWSG